MRAVPNALQTYSPPRSNGSVDSNTSWNGVVPADPTIVAVVKSATPAPIAAGRHQSIVRHRPRTMPAHRNASHGSNGCVPLIATSKT